MFTLSDAPGLSVWPQIDVRSEESIKAAVATIMRTRGRLDVLVNNVGIKARAAGGAARAQELSSRTARFVLRHYDSL